MKKKRDILEEIKKVAKKERRETVIKKKRKNRPLKSEKKVKYQPVSKKEKIKSYNISGGQLRKSVKRRMSLITFFSVAFLWITSSAVMIFVQTAQVRKVTEELIESRLDDMNILVSTGISEYILDPIIIKFRIGENGFCGLHDRDGVEKVYNYRLTDDKFRKNIGSFIKEIINEDKKSSIVENRLFESQYLDYKIFIKHFISDGSFYYVAYKPSEIYGRSIFVTSAVTGAFAVLAIILIIILINLAIKRLMIIPLQNFINYSKSIKDGDLTVNFTHKRDDEFGVLGYSFNETIITLKSLIQKVYDVILVMSKNLRTMYKTSSHVSDSALTQASTVEETVRNFENLNMMVETISAESIKATDLCKKARENAEYGLDSMKNLDDEILKIESSSVEITNIIEMINEIAEQTNLLSLNASIESARAGDAGRGFNIVASEIRKLADKSTISANRIYELIDKNNSVIKEGVKYSKTTTDMLHEINRSNKLINELVSKISEEVTNVRLGSEEILTAINNISDIANGNLTETNLVFDAMEEYAVQTNELQKFVGGFDIRSQQMKDNQKRIEEVLKAKINELDKIFGEHGKSFLKGDAKLKIGEHRVNELMIGKILISDNSEFVDKISHLLGVSVTIFQIIDEGLLRIATTVKNYDESRAIGTLIDTNSQIFKDITKGNEFYGRAFVVNRWYVAVYKPIYSTTGDILGAIYLGLVEDSVEHKD